MQATLHSPLGKVSLGPAPLTIGSAPNNQVVLNDPSVSPRHAGIRPEGQGYSITDLGSASGTFLNEERLEPHMPRLLFSGQTIRIGNTHFTYEAMNGPQIEPTVSAGSRQGSDAAYPPTVAAPLAGYGSNWQSGADAPPPPASSLPSYAVAPAQTPAQKPSRRGLWITLGSVIGLLVIGAVIAGAMVFLNLPTPSKVLNAYCTDIKAGNYKAAYTQYASVVQKSFSEAAFVAQFNILGKPTGCTVGNVDSKNFATVTLTFATGATLVYDNQVASDKINYSKLHSTPSFTLFVYCGSLQFGDYQTAFNQLSSAAKSSVGSADQLAAAYSSNKVTNCTVSTVNNSVGAGTISYTFADGSTGVFDYTLVNENGSWLINSEQAHQ
jgi:FHA domain